MAFRMSPEFWLEKSSSYKDIFDTPCLPDVEGKIMKLKPMDISKERKTLLAWMPHMIGLAFNLDHSYMTPEEALQIFGDAEIIACTTDDHVYYGDRYLQMPQSERNFAFLHELLHGTFCHPERIHLIRLQRGYLYLVLANWAADAIINEAIISDPATQNAVFTEPSAFNIIRMSTIHRVMAEAISFSRATPPSSYSAKAKLGLQMEAIYDWLVWAYEACQEKRANDAAANQGSAGDQSQSREGEHEPSEGRPHADENGSSPEDSGQDSANSKSAGDTEEQATGSSQPDDDADLTEIERIVKSQKAWDLQESDLQSTAGKTLSHSEMIEKANEAIEKARGRIESVIQSMKVQGTGRGSALLSLENDLPEPVVPWNTILRKQLIRDISTNLRDSYTRLSSPARASLALRRPVPFSPGTTIFSDRPRILCVLDVSRSHLEALQQCFAETWSIARMKDAAIDLVTFDDGVRDIIEIRNRRDFDAILRKGLSGGGGTALADLFDQIRKMQSPYKAMVIMTDGYLTPPADTEGFSIIWAITPGGTTNGLEASGTIVNMPDFMDLQQAA
ncbi:MAG: hypothetical protein CL949_04505 [Erythrobacter sp.]|nr:hypothetical protein [Erythrobacter sp.]